MRRQTWVALSIAFAMLVAVPAEAGTRTKTTKSTAKRPSWGFMVTDISVLSHDPQQKLFWCAPYGDGMPEQTAGAEINFGTGWAVFEEPQATRVRDLQSGTLTLERDVSGSWTNVETVTWVDGKWTDPPAGSSVGAYAWTAAYAWTTHGGKDVWRSDFELFQMLDAGDYRFTSVQFELSAGTVDATGGGDPPGPWMTFDDCTFTVVP